MAFDYYTYCCDEQIQKDSDLERFIDDYKITIIERYAEYEDLDPDTIDFDEIPTSFIEDLKVEIESNRYEEGDF
jgi:hypothetical protein